MAGKSRESRIRTLTYAAGSHTFPITGPIRPTASQLMSIFDLSNVLDTIPTSIIERSGIQQIEIVEDESSSNKEMSKKRGNAQHTAFASAWSNGNVKMWKNRETWIMTEATPEQRKMELARISLHEIAHVLDHNCKLFSPLTYYAISHSLAWLTAIDKDQDEHAYSGLSWSRWITKYAASYAANAPETALAEDFADSISCFFTKPNDTRNMLKNWQNRVRVIRQLFPVETETRIRQVMRV